VPAIDPPAKRRANSIDKDSLPVAIRVAESVKYNRGYCLLVAYRRGKGLNQRQVVVDASFGRRLQRAQQIASIADSVRQLRSNEWSVASQSGSGRYRVTSHRAVWDCECRGFSDRSEPCKRILAVILSLGERLPVPPPSPAPRRTYPQHPSYHIAQGEESRLVVKLLRDLVSEIPDFPRPPGVPGPVPISLADQAFCSLLKVYNGKSGRLSKAAFVDAVERGHLEAAPSFMVLSRFLTRPEATQILYRLLSISASPLASLEDGGVVAPDSSGIQTTWFGGWREDKHGERRTRRWLSAHVLGGTRTHVIIRAIVTDANAGDSPRFEPLLRGALEDGFHPGMVVADRGYLAEANYALAKELGIEARIPFKSNSRNRAGNRGRSRAWRDAFYLFQTKREEFDSDYHKRSNVESIFSALKRKFGENVRSRNPTAQVNEILCKLICYNLSVVVHEMFEHGIAPTFQDRPGEAPGRARTARQAVLDGGLEREGDPGTRSGTAS